MDTLSREKRLTNLLNAEERAHPAQIERLLHRRKTTRLGTVLNDLAGYARTRALYAYFIGHDLGKCKQDFYLASKLALASVGQDGGASFEVGSDIQIALLSDCDEVVKERKKSRAAEIPSLTLLPS
ncbi:hypothetical protein J2801_006082 [Paraburkholderia phenoliruptrix]|uniref:hypothetical protein n=1 Tax=Paraburkholderia phenoliruptrix TaxID=252970 RepID=UPI002860B6AC|nr:hypothetical protein [Paraburkholderia phenoliruptrix]MDR6423779.1 hypothetical protein [Paraburkholderia phenoliruptrix]